ncbi:MULTISPECIES: amidohydrolase family protein [Phyllobacteriaceae]|jgi:predicted TIM-barrel fold metal-dependent hydrolase|uniref:Amidohydrolase n=1 Tax=Mesorhizobium hungaricum TaxID=1566387 RepID=A0A1C2EDR8_9HYPH|nr:MULTISPECIES: amidohydrolase [Mesorhizobium]MBN9237799.1 amidohydrolase [Mesorhizobium sp.]MDQ0329464.1 putative TIM-barrel fold metal-dependent hydrolase [Mesorhizobium sp. YL-MeA3-2017]OCX25158.1 amidohydrolase [Mesorhizobium hungaricum]
MQLIDTHQHLIYRDQLGYGWTNGIPALASGNFTRSDYGELTRGDDVIGTVFMETGVDDADYQKEARFVASLVGGDGLLAQVASCRPEIDEGFDAWLDECDRLSVAGFRRILHVVDDEMSRSETFRKNLRKIGRKDLAFDMCFLARQLPIAADLAKACPDQRFVLDHCGVPDIAGDAFSVWADAISEVARSPNVSVKLSGVTAYCTPGTANVETLRRWIDHIVQVFTPARIVWGGDWPVVNLGSGLPAWIEITKELLADLSADEQAAIGTGNARRIYRLS